MRSYPVALSAVLAALALSCSSVPSSGHVKAIGTAPPAGAPAKAPGPQIGVSGTKYDSLAAPVQVVSGFLDAEVDTSDGGKANVDAYLTPTTSWDREAGALIYSTREVQLLPQSADDAHREVRVTYQLVARINIHGEFLPASGSESQTFDLAGPVGGWHIAGLPAGRRIDKGSLDQVYTRVVPYFPSADVDARVLIPDPVYVLRDKKPALSSLVERLLTGPTPALRAALAQANPAAPAWSFPPGTKLLTALVDDNNIAEVTFSGELDQVPRAPSSKRDRIVAQLIWTLTSQDLQIAAVRIKVEDHPFQFAGGTRPEQSQAQWARYDPDLELASRSAYFNLGGRLATYDPSSSIRPGRALDDANAPPSVDGQATRVAIVAAVPHKPLRELRVGPTTGAGKLVTQLSADRLTDPSWGNDSDGVWVVSQQGEAVPQVLTAQAAKSPTKRIAAEDLNARVDAFEVAPDGTRVAAIIERAGERRVEIGYITRGVFGAQALRVGGWRAVTTGIDVSEVTWADSGKLALIGKRGTEAASVFTALVDGSALQQSAGSADTLGGGDSAHLVALPVQHDDAKRGDLLSGGLMLVVSRGTGAAMTTELYVNRGTGWLLRPRPS